MSFIPRTKDNAGDVGRAADQQASVDNDDHFKVAYVQLVIKDWHIANEVADDLYFFQIPPKLNGMNLTYLHAYTITAGVTGTQTIQIHNLTDASDMLSALLTIPTGVKDSTTYTINLAEDDIATDDILRIDVDTVHTTPALGLIITLGFTP